MVMLRLTPQLAQILQDALATMTEAQRLALLESMSGSDALRETVLLVGEKGPEEMSQLSQLALKLGADTSFS